MKVIGVISTKGGTGKTTIATHLGVEISRLGKTTVILDLDPQATATQWADDRGEESTITVQALPSSRLQKVLEAARASKVDFVIADTAPHSDKIAGDVAETADIILVPTTPQPFDLRETPKTIRLIRNTTRKPVYIVFGKVTPNSHEFDTVAEVINGLSLDCEIYPHPLTYRATYKHAQARGQTAQEYDPQSVAAQEIAELTKWLIDKIA